MRIKVSNDARDPSTNSFDRMEFDARAACTQLSARARVVGEKSRGWASVDAALSEKRFLKRYNRIGRVVEITH